MAVLGAAPICELSGVFVVLPHQQWQPLFRGILAPCQLAAAGSLGADDVPPASHHVRLCRCRAWRDGESLGSLSGANNALPVEGRVTVNNVGIS